VKNGKDRFETAPIISSSDPDRNNRLRIFRMEFPHGGTFPRISDELSFRNDDADSSAELKSSKMRRGDCDKKSVLFVIAGLCIFLLSGCQPGYVNRSGSATGPFGKDPGPGSAISRSPAFNHEGYILINEASRAIFNYR